MVQAEEDSEILRLIDARVAKAMERLRTDFAEPLQQLQLECQWARQQFTTVEADIKCAVASASSSADLARGNHDKAIDAIEVARKAFDNDHEILRRQVEQSASDASVDMERRLIALKQSVERALEKVLDTADRNMQAAQEKTRAKFEVESKQACVESKQVSERTERAGAATIEIQKKASEQQDQLQRLDDKVSQWLSDMEQAMKSKTSLEHFDEAVECLRAAQGQKDRVVDVQGTFFQERIESVEATLSEKANRRELMELFERKTDRQHFHGNADTYALVKSDHYPPPHPGAGGHRSQMMHSCSTGSLPTTSSGVRRGMYSEFSSPVTGQGCQGSPVNGSVAFSTPPQESNSQRPGPGEISSWMSRRR